MTRTISSATASVLRTALAVAATLALAGCGGAAQVAAPQAPPAATTTAAERAPEPIEPPVDGGPPPVTVRGAGDPLDLEPWTWCWSGPTSGAYDVDLSGRGPGGNDANVTFRWTTPVDGPTPVPEATIAVLDEHDGQVAGYGVSLAVSGLATTPRRASAHVTVTSSEGASLGLDPAAARGTCSPEGSVWFDGPSGQGDVASLGSAPFTYDVVLTLDGVEHRATATWPRHERSGPDESPDTPLRFTPPLPALAP